MSYKEGTVKSFNDGKGYGFISQSDGGPDVFVHFSAIRGSGLKPLQEGQHVRYKTEQGRMGLQAVNVEVI